MRGLDAIGLVCVRIEAPGRTATLGRASIGVAVDTACEDALRVPDLNIGCIRMGCIVCSRVGSIRVASGFPAANFENSRCVLSVGRTDVWPLEDPPTCT